jgi:hypothetical protein
MSLNPWKTDPGRNTGVFIGVLFGRNGSADKHYSDFIIDFFEGFPKTDYYSAKYV